MYVYIYIYIRQAASLAQVALFALYGCPGAARSPHASGAETA
jgi:hypothetical protein